MSNVLNRITKQYIESVNTPDFPETEWLINPETSSIKDFNPKYLIIEGDRVREATGTEKNAIDLQTPPPELSEIDKIKEDIKTIFLEIENLKKA